MKIVKDNEEVVIETKPEDWKTLDEYQQSIIDALSTLLS